MTTTLLRALLLPMLAISLATLLGACSRYQFVLNNNVLYSPTGVPATPGIFADANLQGCLNQHFINNGSNDPESIKLLACPSAGIQSLAGISALPNLEQLELSDNTITDIRPLQNLKNLRVLSMSNNRLNNIAVLTSLPILRFVVLAGNSNIPCRQLDELEEKIGNTLTRPASCVN